MTDRNEINPYAYFDAVAIAIELQQTLGNVKAGEIHLFAYLACLLSLYKKWAVADWRYSFGTQNGAPFSRDIDEVMKVLYSHGHLSEKDDLYLVTSRGHDEYATLKQLAENAKRLPYINGACSSILALPVGIVREALSQEPELRSATLSASRSLLDEYGPHIHTLHEQFSELSSAVGVDIQELMVPAVVWLTYLVEAQTGSVDKTEMVVR